MPPGTGRMDDFEALLAGALRKLESNHQSGHNADLCALVDAVNSQPASARERLARELVKADMSLHRLPAMAADVTQIRPVEAYLASFDDVTFDEDAILELIEHEYRLRIAGGDVPEVDELTSRFSWLGPAALDRISTLRQRLLIESSIRSLLADDDDLDELRRRGGNPDALVPTGGSPQILVGEDESLAERLKLVPPFCELSQIARDAISAKLVVQQFREGDVLLRQGEVADSMLIVLDGAVEVLLDGDGAPHSLARLGRNTIVGEIGMMTREVRSANVVAVTAGRAATIGRDDYEHLAGRYPRLSVVLSELIAERVGVLTIDALCGKTIGGYRIKHRLGRGGMGIVYSAVDEATREPAALKMLRHDLTFDRHAALRFQQEAEIVRDLLHPNIVRIVHEFSAFGTSFIAMELCDGPTLSDMIRRAGALPRSVVRPFVGQIATALHYAHAAGVAHRDLKPSNVMLTRNGTAKLVDFGLARSTTAQHVDLTGVGQIMGTPRYMAPEQLNGERGDARSDVFSLGCMIFEMLTGRPIFKSTTWQDLLRERTAWSLPPLEGIWVELDSELYEFLVASLAEHPRDRPRDLSPIAAWAGHIDCSAPVEIESDTKLATSPDAETVRASR
jgi:CRP-like cAMP-binding protein